MSTLFVDLHTNLGKIRVALNEQAAPKSVENFLKYVREGHYDNTIFHRVIPGFMIQGGGFIANMQQKDTHAPIENEARNGLVNEKYTVAMARTNNPHSATAQFFINVNNNAFLNHTTPTPQGWGYAVFGEVVQGHEIVDLIAQVKTASRGFHQDVPVDPVVIERTDVVEHEVVEKNDVGSLESALGDSLREHLFESNVDVKSTDAPEVSEDGLNLVDGLDATRTYPRGQTPYFQAADERAYAPLVAGSVDKQRVDAAQLLATLTVPEDQQREAHQGYSWTLHVSIQKGSDGQLHISRLDVRPETEAETRRRRGETDDAAPAQAPAGEAAAPTKLEDL